MKRSQTSTSVCRKDPAKGWYIGTGRGKLEADVAFGPHGSEWKSNRVRGDHAQLYIHREAWQTMVEARHSVEVSGSTGLKHIGLTLSIPATSIVLSATSSRSCPASLLTHCLKQPVTTIISAITRDCQSRAPTALALNAKKTCCLPHVRSASRVYRI